MCKFVGKIKQIIPFKGEIEKIDSFVGKFIKNYKSPIYDNELPIEWKTVEIKNSSNMLYAYDNTKVKISSYVPTVDELLKMKLTLSYNDDKEVYELVSQASSINEFGHHTVHFKSTENNIWEYLTIVPKGKTIPHGLYWESDDYLGDEAYENGTTYKLYAPVYYDDELPITWNSVQVANAFNTTDGDYVKISNLTLTAEEMETIVITFVLDGETIELPYSHTNEGTYLYTDESATAVVQLRVLDDGLYAGNYGSVDWNGEIWDADFTASVVEQPDIPDTPTGIYDDEWPIEWNSLAVQGNVVLGDFIKISNLTPTQAEMETVTLTENGVSFEYWKAETSDGFIMYYYQDSGTETRLIVVITDSTVAGATENGMYAQDFYKISDGEMNADFTLTLPVTASTYLYGREADSVVSYNGVTLPDIESVWTDELKQQYPYVYIAVLDIGDGAVYGGLILSESTPTYNTETMEHLLYCGYAEYMFANNQELADMFGIPAPNVWCFTEEGSSDGNITLDHSTWCNHDILNSDGTTYLAASDPVKSYPDADVIVDGVGYVGAVLPNIDEVWTDKETYPYASIEIQDYSEDIGVDGAIAYILYLTSVVSIRDGESSNPAFSDADVCIYRTTSCPELAEIGESVGMIAGVNEWKQGDGNDDRFHVANFAMLPIWTSYDLINTYDNSVYLASSDPIPVSSIVGYSYNGTVLPELPEWDKTVYPYGTVKHFSGNIYYFYAYAERPYISAETGNMRVSQTTQALAYVILASSSDDWGDGTEKEQSPDSDIILPCWTDFDLLNEDGTVYLAASDPIPIYE